MSGTSPDRARFEAWLDGRLDEDERRAFERRLQVEPALAAELALERRLETELARRFTPPADPAAGLARALERVPVPAAQPGSARRAAPWIALAAAAGLALWVGLRVAPSAPDAPRGSEGGHGGGLARVPLDAGVPSAAPEVEHGSLGPAIARPDLQSLYESTTSPSGVAACTSPEELAQTFAGTSLRMRPEAAARLHGPVASEEWPSGTVLFGYADGTPAIVVAEDEDRMRCCVRAELSSSSGLQVFTWRVGATLLTEVTPLSEPRLLQLFERGP
jgi:hypothetical protein